MKQIYSVKNVKLVYGHDGKIMQCSVYKNNKRIGIFSEDAWGGPARLIDMSRQDEKDIMEFAKEFTGDTFSEEYSIMLSELGSQFLVDKDLKAVCRKKIAFVTAEQKEGEYWTMPGKLTTANRKDIMERHSVKFFYNDRYGLGVG